MKVSACRGSFFRPKEFAKDTDVSCMYERTCMASVDDDRDDDEESWSLCNPDGAFRFVRSGEHG